MRYFIQRDHSQFGPFDESEIIELLASGAILPNDLAAPEGNDQFLPLRQFSFMTQTVSNPTISSTLNSPKNPFTSENPATYTQAETAVSNGRTTPGNLAAYISQTSKRYRPKDLFTVALEVLRDKRGTWTAIMSLPIGTAVLILIFYTSQYMSTIISSLTNVLSPVNLTPNTSMPNLIPNISIPTLPIMPMIIAGMFFMYILLTALGMFIQGTADYYDGIDSGFKDLFLETLPKIPKLAAFLLISGLLFGIILLPACLLPQPLRVLGFISILLISICSTFRLFPLCFVLFLDNLSLNESIRQSLKLSKRNVSRIGKLTLFIIVIQSLVGIATAIMIFIGVAGLATLVYTPILATVFYKDLVERADAEG